MTFGLPTHWVIAALSVVLFALSPAVAASGPVELLMFEEPGCPWCKRWHEEVGVGYPLTPEGKRAPLRRLELARAGQAGVRLASPVTASPTFVLISEGREVGRITGYPGAAFFWGLLEGLLKKIEPDRR